MAADGRLIAYSDTNFATRTSSFDSNLGLSVKGGAFIGKNIRVSGCVYTEDVFTDYINNIILQSANNSIAMTVDEITQSYSVVLGQKASARDSSASGNVIVGYEAGTNDNLGNYNVILGHQAGYSLTSGNNNVIIGAGANISKATDSNEIVIGRNVIGKGSDTVTIGNANTTDVYLSADEGADVWMGKGHNCIWNDIADCIEVPEETELEFGRCYCFDGKTYHKSNKYAEDGFIGIHSDTAGLYLGEKKKQKELRAAIGGFVLAYVDKEYKPGTPLTCGKNGEMTYIRLIDRILYPHKIVATFWKNETQEKWNDVLVNKRMWVKIK